jgi:hypothetical protein
MARTIEVIQHEMIVAKEADAVLGAELTSDSDVAEWLLWTHLSAVQHNAVESNFDNHAADVDAKIATLKPHTTRWYETMARAFQYGVALPADSDVYAVLPPADPTVLIVNYVSAQELTNKVRIKVAKNAGADLGPLSDPEITSLRAYMARIKDAGLRLEVTTGDPDSLRLDLTVYYDPLVLTNAGARIDGTAATPVKDAIKAFLKGIQFGAGLFIPNYLTAALSVVPGVRIAVPSTIMAKYAALPYTAIGVEYLPDAGYLRIDEAYLDAHTTYIAHAPIN